MPRFPQVAHTVSSLSSDVYNALTARARELREEGRELFPLHVGDTWMPPPECARSESLKVSEHPGLHQYAPPHGMPALLSAIEERLRFLGREVPSNRIQVVAGATNGLSIVAEALFSPGDELLLPSPYWPLIRGITAKRGAVPVEVPVWHDLHNVDFEAALEAKVTERTTALYLNSPHNPTGRVLEDAHVDAAVRVAKRHDLWLIVDEAYQDLWFESARRKPIWARDDVQDRYIASHTLSKSYGLAGARVGYIHGAEAAMRAIQTVQTYSMYSAPTPMQLGSAAVLRQGESDFLAHRREEFGTAGRETAALLGLEAPRGGTFVFFDTTPYLPADATDSLPFLMRALEAGVILTPGSACGQDFKRWVRLCFTSLPLADHRRALRALGTVLSPDAP